MEDKRRQYLKFIFLFIYIIFCSYLTAQESGYFVDYSESEPRFFQRIVWELEEHALEYEVLILVLDSSGYNEYLREITEKRYIEVSLPPGNYRYGITPYDILGRKGDVSEWREFVVFQAFQPVIDRYIPNVFFLDQRVNRILDISGENFFEQSEIYLRAEDTFLFPYNVEILSSGRARLYFNDETLETGTYDLYIKNPGGLDFSKEGFLVGYRKPVDIFFKINWLPILPVSGYMYDVFGLKLKPAGLGFNIEFISSKRSTFNGGVELGFSLFFIDPAHLFTGAPFTDININIALQKRLMRGMAAVTFRFGFGGGGLGEFGNYMEENYVIHFNLNCTAMFFIFNNFYLEFGGDFSHYLTSISSGVIYPRLGLVWKF